MKKKKIISILLVSLMLLSVTGCQEENAGSDNEQQGGNTEQQGGDAEQGSSIADELVFAIGTDDGGLDPHQTMATREFHQFLTPSLVAYSSDGKTLVPNVAKDIQISEDGLTVTIKLDTSYKFEDGTVVNAEAIKANYERFKEMGSFNMSNFTNIESIETPDEETVILKASEYSATIYSSLVDIKSTGVINPYVANQTAPEDFIQNIVGYGPYTLVESLPSSHVKVTRNADYRHNNPSYENKEAPMFENINFRVIPDMFTRYNELAAGNVDIAGLNYEILEEAKDNSEIYILEAASTIERVLFVSDKGATADENVRMAIAKAIDREEIASAYEDTVIPTYGLLTPVSIDYLQSIEDELKSEFAPNAEEARTILEDAGYVDSNDDGIYEKDGKDLEIKLATDSGEAGPDVLLMQAQLKEAGMTLNIEAVAGNQIVPMALDGSAELVYLIYGAGSGSTLGAVFTSQTGIINIEEVDAAFEKAATVVDLEERAVAYGDAVKLLLRTGRAIPVYADKNYYGIRNELKDVKLTNFGSVSIQDAYMEQ